MGFSYLFGRGCWLSTCVDKDSNLHIKRLCGIAVGGAPGRRRRSLALSPPCTESMSSEILKITYI